MTSPRFPKPVKRVKARRPLQNRTPLKRSRIKRRSPRRLSKPVAEAGQKYMAFVRTLSCVCLSEPFIVKGEIVRHECSGAMEANHGGEKPGVALKAPDSTVFPMCHSAHAQWTDHAGIFRGWSKELRRGWADAKIALTRQRARDEGALRWKDTDPDFVYPPSACKGGVECPSCPLFRCSKCREQRPWCVGADDDRPNWCNDCRQAFAPSEAA